MLAASIASVSHRMVELRKYAEEKLVTNSQWVVLVHPCGDFDSNPVVTIDYFTDVLRPDDDGHCTSCAAHT